jgi:hypothetical protein
MMLAQVIERDGRRCRWFAPGQSACDVVEDVLSVKPVAICVSAMPPMAVSHARLIFKHLRAAHSSGRMVIGIWDGQDRAQAARRLATDPQDAIVSTLAEALVSLRGERVPS